MTVINMEKERKNSSEGQIGFEKFLINLKKSIEIDKNNSITYNIPAGDIIYILTLTYNNKGNG